MKKKLIFISKVTLFVVSSTFFACGNANKHIEVQEEEAMEQQEINVDEAVVYSCTMHPEITGKEGDICSECSMELSLNESH